MAASTHSVPAAFQKAKSIPPAAVVDDGEAAQSLAFRDAFRMLERRISLFLALPIASLDRLALTREVDAIGHIRSGTIKDLAS
jgi:arsenate reductase (thioredoxin)